MKIKRLFDIFGSGLLLLACSPLMLIVAFFVSRKSGRPVLFRQPRAGLNGMPFEILKFRTMRNAFDSRGSALPDDQRLTTFGKFLRSSSIDELPELFNVLRGDMSLVGPRPLLMDYLPLYSDIQKHRHDVRPGITGWAQINGRNAISWQKKLELDLWYVDNQSFRLDLKILFLTIWKVAGRYDINQPGSATVEPFNGNN